MKENLIGQFARYVSLSIVGTLAQSFYIIADTIFIARGIGADAIAALNIALPIFGIIFGFGMMIGMGGGTRASISQETKSATFTLCVSVATVLSVIFLLIGVFFADRLAILFGATEEIMGLTRIYLRTVMLFSPAFMLNSVFVCFVRNDGSPHLSSIAMFSSSLSNIVLDYIFIFPLGMGMFGAAFATAVSPVISMSILSLHFIFKKNTFKFTFDGFKFRFKNFFDVCALGISSFINEIANSIVVMVFNFIILGLIGTIGISAYGIIANFSLMIINLFAGIAQGIQPISSLAYGQGRQNDVKRIYRYALVLTILIGVSIYSISFVHTDMLIAIFNKENSMELAMVADRGIKLYFMGFVFAGISIISSTLLSSVERAVSAFIPSILRGFALIIPMAYIMSYLFKIDGVWLSFSVTEFIVMIISFGLMISALKKRPPKEL